MKYIRIKNINVAYTSQGQGQGHTILILHGWGTSSKSFEEVSKRLSKTNKVYTIDLPGFGQSDQPDEVWGTHEYSGLIKNFMDALKISQPIVIGHSFGGRIGISLAKDQLLSQLVLICSAGLKSQGKKKVTKWMIFRKTFAFLEHIPGISKLYFKFLDYMRNHVGSRDYRQAQGVMRSILVKTISEDLKEHLEEISIPTLLLWGELDSETPMYMAKTFEEKITNSKLVVYQGEGHFPYKNKPGEVVEEITSFLNL